MKNWIKKSFKRELLAGFFLVAVLPLVVSWLFLIELFEMKAENDYRKLDMEQARAVNDVLSGLLDEVEETARRLVNRQEVRRAMAVGDYGKKSEIYGILYGETAKLRDRVQFDIYSADGVCQYSTGAGMYQEKIPSYWGILKVAAAHGDEFLIRRAQDSGANPICLQAALGILGQDGVPVGFLVADITKEHFETVFRGIYGGQDGICILDEFYETVYSAGTAGRGSIGPVLRKNFLKGEEPVSSWDGNMVYVSALGDTGLTTVLLRPEVFTDMTTGAMYTVLFILTILCLLLCMFVASRLSSHLSRPVRILNDAMDEVRAGQLETRVKLRRADELGQLSESFNSMTGRLEEYMREQVAQQKKLADVQIAMMQAQLNPHFLYNTLDTMKWVAKANHIPEIATLSAKLAKILRTSISSAQMISLKEEMELADSYAEIQKIRFGARFSFSCELPEELSGLLVPKLIIQPIVENAMLHGLADRDEGNIAVRAFKDLEGKFLYIEVTDDGCGISDDVLSRLNSRDREQLTGHIGFYNVDTMIRLHYGDGYGLRAERRPEGGTKVLIILPGKEETDEV